MQFFGEKPLMSTHRNRLFWMVQYQLLLRTCFSYSDAPGPTPYFQIILIARFRMGDKNNFALFIYELSAQSACSQKFCGPDHFLNQIVYFSCHLILPFMAICVSLSSYIVSILSKVTIVLFFQVVWTAHFRDFAYNCCPVNIYHLSFPWVVCRNSKSCIWVFFYILFVWN